MNIALCHDAIIPPLKYGGTERVIYWLAKALIEIGHTVTLVAKPGSNIPGVRFVEYRSHQSLDKQVPNDVDVIHLWCTPAAPPKRPHLVTIEGNGQPGETFLPNTLFISQKHAENHGAENFVYNGIDPHDYHCEQVRDDYLVFLAKAKWKVKNLEGAIQIARRAQLPLNVLGSTDLPLGIHRLIPRIRGVKYFGMVADPEKRLILSRARALLFPVRWHEPFGIAITEALASGCPVLGTPYGSLPEIVSQDVGVLSSNAEDLVAPLKNLEKFTQTFPPEKCRARVLEKFSHLEMAKNYLRHYESVYKTGQLARALGAKSQGSSAQAPSTKAGFQSEFLLKWTGFDRPLTAPL